MRPWIIGVAAALACGAAQAQPAGQTPPRTTILCLEPSGRSIPALCHVPASRLDQSEFICQCFGGGMRTVVPVCPDGVDPPPESAALERARRDGVRKGSLVGATFQGRPICVAPRGMAR